MRGFMAVGACLFFILPARAQWQQQSSGADVQLRGVSAVSENVAWASGAKGTVLRTVDGGETWTKVNVPGAEALDFRDVQGFDANTAFVLSIGPGEQSRIYKTTDGGKSWQLQFTNKDPKAFYDCFAFWDSKHGIAVSDSVDGKFPLIATSDGATWNPVAIKSMPAALPNEGAFAASGTCIATFGKKDVWFGTGGPAARVFHSADRGVNWTVAETPILHGEASQGIFSVAFLSRKNGVAVGGDYQHPFTTERNSAITRDGGKSWSLPQILPNGYRSGLSRAGKELWISVGPGGADYARDGEHWWRPGVENRELLQGDAVEYNSISCSHKICWVVGPHGRIGRLRNLPKVSTTD
jgi:photosystem II stability/assembly factor-like uncharacterized protein